MEHEIQSQSPAVDYDQLAEDYALHRNVQPKVLKQLISQAGINARSKVLEVGCGTGNYIAAIHAATGCPSWGIDPSFRMLSKAREKFTQIDFRPGVGEQTDFQDNFFDLLFSVDVIHHIQDRQRYFRETGRVLAAGRKICTVTESGWMIRNRRPFSVYFPETAGVDLKRYPQPAALRKMMVDGGFTHIYNQTVNFSFVVTKIQDFQDKAYSCLHLIPEDSFQRGIERMEQDLKTGPVAWISRYLLIWGVKATGRPSE